MPDEADYGTRPWTESPTTPPSTGLSIVETPLGEPMDQASASVLAESPVAWHLRYWLNLGSIGILSGQDETLMALRIEMEQSLIPNLDLRLAVHRTWEGYRIANNKACLDYWRRLQVRITQTGEDQEETDPRYQAVKDGERLLEQHCRDLDRILVNKTQRAKTHLRQAEGVMIANLRAGTSLETAIEIFSQIGSLYEKLHQEEVEDERVGNSLPNGVNGVHH